MTEWMLAGLMGVEILVLALVMARLPAWSRQGIYFSATVPHPFRDEARGRAIAAGYRRWVWAGTVLALLLLVLGAARGTVGWLIAGPLLQIATFLAAYVIARQQVLRTRGGTLPADPHPSPLALDQWVPSPPYPRLSAGDVAVGLGPFALLAAMAVYLATRWQEIPGRYVTHWGAGFEPDGWTDKGVVEIFWPLLTGAFFCLGMTFLAWGMLRWGRRSPIAADPSEPARRRAVAGLVVAINYFLAALFALLGLIPLVQSATAARSFVVAVVAGAFLAPMAILLGWFVRYGKRFSAASRGTAATGDGTPDAAWKGGLIYYNPDDPAIFVEKRFGIGYTMNFARPASWWVLAAILLLPLLPMVLLMLL